MVSKIENKNKDKDSYKDLDSDSDDGEIENEYSGFNMIPMEDESDDDSVYSENLNVGYEIKPGGETYEQYLKNENNGENDDDDNGNQNENGEEGFGDFVDFKNHSDQFHSLDSFSFNNNNSDINDNDIEAKLKSNPMLRNMDFSEYFPKNENDPFASSNTITDELSPSSSNTTTTDSNNNSNIYSERNEKGHMVLEKNKLFPPDHVALIQECMKNIKLDYKPMWSNFISEDKWMGALKTKINPSLQNNNNNTTANTDTNTNTNTDTNNNTN